MAALESGATSDEELTLALPRLRALPRGVSASREAVLGSPSGEAILRLASRLRFLAQSQITWWQHLPPWRWLGDQPRAAAFVARCVDDVLVAAFAPAELDTARLAVTETAQLLVALHKQARQAGSADKRSVWSLALARGSLTAGGVQADSQLLTRSEERVLSGDEHDAIFADEAAAATRRQQLMDAAEASHGQLLVR